MTTRLRYATHIAGHSRKPSTQLERVWLRKPLGECGPCKDEAGDSDDDKQSQQAELEWSITAAAVDAVVSQGHTFRSRLARGFVEYERNSLIDGPRARRQACKS